MPQIVTLDLATLTLGEMSKAEMESGMDFAAILKGGVATRRLLALWVQEQRSSAQPRSWREVASLRLSDVSSSTSPSAPDGARETSPT